MPRLSMIASLLIALVSCWSVSTTGAFAAASPDSARAPLTQNASAVDSAVTTAQASSPDYVAEVRANYTPEARSYWTTKTVLGLFGLAYSIVAGLLVLFLGWSAKIRDVAVRASRFRYVRVLIYLALISLVLTLLDFPLAWYSGYALEHQYHLSTQSLGAWLGDQGKDYLVSLVVVGVIPLLMLAYLAIEKSPRRWWLWLALGSIPVFVIALVVVPVVVDPLYNKFIPLKDQQLKAKILALAEKADIPSRKVYQVDKSKQTKKYNAYVSGFGASQRIVLWDTTLQGMKDDEILMVMGHEMGHYKLGHTWKLLIFDSVLFFVLFYLAWWGTRWAIARFGQRWGFTELSDLASFPLLLVALGVISLVVQPISSGFSRTLEHEADVFGLEVTRSNDAGARAFIKLGSQNKSNPEPPAALKYFEYDHPPLIERIRFAISYRPWEKGEPNRAFKPKR